MGKHANTVILYNTLPPFCLHTMGSISKIHVYKVYEYNKTNVTSEI